MANTEYQRIADLLDYLGLNALGLSKELGLKTPQIFYDIKSGKCGISKGLAQKIQEHFLNINPAWLVTGEGEMLKSNNEPRVNSANEAASGSELIVKMMNEKQIAPYGLLEDKDKQIEKLNRQIGRLEAELEAAKRENARKGGRAECADVV